MAARLHAVYGNVVVTSCDTTQRTFVSTVDLRQLKSKVPLSRMLLPPGNPIGEATYNGRKLVGRIGFGRTSEKMCVITITPLCTEKPRISTHTESGIRNVTFCSTNLVCQAGNRLLTWSVNKPLSATVLPENEEVIMHERVVLHISSKQCKIEAQHQTLVLHTTIPIRFTAVSNTTVALGTASSTKEACSYISFVNYETMERSSQAIRTDIVISGLKWLSEQHLIVFGYNGSYSIVDVSTMKVIDTSLWLKESSHLPLLLHPYTTCCRSDTEFFFSSNNHLYGRDLRSSDVSVCSLWS